MVTADGIAEKVRGALATELRLSLSEIQPDKRIGEDLGADSLTRVELVMRLEEIFGFKISDDEALQLVTVGDVIRCIEQKAKSTRANTST